MVLSSSKSFMVLSSMSLNGSSEEESKLNKSLRWFFVLCALVLAVVLLLLSFKFDKIDVIAADQEAVLVEPPAPAIGGCLIGSSTFELVVVKCMGCIERFD